MQTYSFKSTGINIFKALGSSEGKIGFFVSGDGEQASQSISGFSFSYGSPTIQAQSLEMSSSGQIGSASSPVLILVTGNVLADAPSGVYLLQTDGDMYVESVTSTGNISLSAPTASVINSGTSQIQASRFMKPTSVGRIGRVAADHVAVQALFSIASADRPLIIQASGLSASAIQGDICLSQTGPLTIDGPVVAGGAISIVSDSSILLASVARATRSITIETLPNFSGSSRIEIEPGASVISLTDKVSLIGGEGVSLSRGATISSMAMDGRSNVIFVSILGDIENLPPFEVSVDGDVRADRIDIVSHNNGSNHFLNLPGIIGLTHVPMVYFSGANNKTVTLDDSGNNGSNSITIENGRINTKDQIIELSAVDHVIMTLGEGADMVLVGKKTGLEQLVISAGEGDDFVSTTISATDSLIQRIDGGNGVNDLLIDSDNQSVWMKNQQVSTLQGYVEYLNQKRVVVSGTSVSNALPVANRFVFESITDGRHLTNKEYVLMLYQQILNRNATDSEQASGTRLLNRNALNREQLARRMLNSSESLQIQVNAWYITYLNRQASRQEILRNVAALRRGLSAQSLISRLLVGQEFYDRTQQMFATGSAADRYIKGLYSLAISPSDSPDNALMRFLRQNLQQQGRQGVVNQVLKSMPMGRNQSEAISIKVNHRPATSGMSVGKIGPNGLTARLLSRK
jgi:hypothetical protein